MLRASVAYGSFCAATATKTGIESPIACAALSASNVAADADRLTTACTLSSAAIAIESDAPNDPPTSTTEVAPVSRAYATTARRSSSRASERASYAMARHPRSANAPARPKKSSFVPVAP